MFFGRKLKKIKQGNIYEQGCGKYLSWLMFKENHGYKIHLKLVVCGKGMGAGSEHEIHNITFPMKL